MNRKLPPEAAHHDVQSVDVGGIQIALLIG